MEGQHSLNSDGIWYPQELSEESRFCGESGFDETQDMKPDVVIFGGVGLEYRQAEFRKKGW